MYRPEVSRSAQTMNAFVNSLLSGSILIIFSSLLAPTKIEELTAGSDDKTQLSPAVFSSDPAVRSSIFVGAEKEENLIRNDPDESEFTMEWIEIQRVFIGRCVFVDSGNPGHLVMEKELTAW